MDPVEKWHEDGGLSAFRIQDLLTKEELLELEEDRDTGRDWRQLLRQRISALHEVRETLDGADEGKE